MTDEGGRADSQALQELLQHACIERYRDPLLWHWRVAKAGQVHGDHTVAGKCGQLLEPMSPPLDQAMDGHERRPSTSLDHIHGLTV
jgi:hypothetical protein